MNKLTLLLFLVVVILSGFAQKPTLSVKIDGLNNDTVFVRYLKLNDLTEGFDTVIASDGEFTVKFKTPVVVAVIPLQTLYFRSVGGIFAPFSKFIRIPLYEDLNIHATLSERMLKYEVSGSEVLHDYVELRNTHLNNLIAADSLEIVIDNLEAKEENKEIAQTLFEERNRISTLFIKDQVKYVEENQNDLSAYFVYNLNIRDFEKYYELLNKKQRNGIFKNGYQATMDKIKEYKEVLANKERMKSGNQAPDFRLEGPFGFNFGLNYCDKTGTVKDTDEGKVAETVELILLDFWGTWCGPCIAEMPRIKEIKEKYPKRLRIISIACNESSKEKWAEYVKGKKDLMAYNWFHVIDEKNEVWKKYGVEAFPTFVLVDNRTDKELIGTFNSREIYKKVEEILGE